MKDKNIPENEKRIFGEQLSLIQSFTSKQNPFRCQDIVEALKEQEKELKQKYEQYKKETEAEYKKKLMSYCSVYDYEREKKKYETELSLYLK